MSDKINPEDIDMCALANDLVNRVEFVAAMRAVTNAMAPNTKESNTNG